MKNSVKIIGLMLLLAFVSNGTLNAQRGMRNRMDTTSMGRSTDSLSMKSRRNRINSQNFRGNRQVMSPFAMPWMRGPGQMRGMRGMRGVWQVPQYNMRRGMERIPIDRLDRSRTGRSRMGIERIPNLTEEQKKEITDLRKQQQDEMNKIRDEMSEKMRILKEEYRSILLDKLTDEQKRAFESRLR